MPTPERPFEGENITYAVTTTALGLALVAKSEKGLAALLLGDDEDSLLRQLDATLQGARLERDQEGLTHDLDGVARLLGNPSSQPSFDLDLRGSEVQLAVWEALRSIPAGETVTYGQLAKRIDQVAIATAQEVGAACAANRVAVSVPCHRVVKADGSISGYRWGVGRKRKLLNLERST